MVRLKDSKKRVKYKGGEIFFVDNISCMLLTSAFLYAKFSPVPSTAAGASVFSSGLASISCTGSGPWWNSLCSFPEWRSKTNCFNLPGTLRKKWIIVGSNFYWNTFKVPQWSLYTGPFAPHSPAPHCSLCTSAAFIHSLTPQLMGKRFMSMIWMRWFHSVLTHSASTKRSETYVKSAMLGKMYMWRNESMARTGRSPSVLPKWWRGCENFWPSATRKLTLVRSSNSSPAAIWVNLATTCRSKQSDHILAG